MSGEEQEEKKHAHDLMACGPDRSSASNPRATEQDLPPELKAIEAELASLRPRTDRLDRERLIFLAGQQSVAGGHISATKRARRRGWPTAFAAMTAVAATLLVMLLLRPEPQVEVRIVKVPVERRGSGEAAPGANAPKPPGEGPRHGPPPENPKLLPKPVAGSGLFALVGLDWSQPYDRDRLGSEMSYRSLRDRVLRDGVDAWPSPPPGADVKPMPAPLPYRKLLEKALGTPAPDGPVPDRPLLENLLYPGANS
jgi:hypothetical protein